jgi:4-hydroxy-L-threonine phosphate dehydrogenase PdxA
MNKYLTIVAGDPNSIGFEILGKALRKLSTKSKKKNIISRKLRITQKPITKT